jgi:hypothetical protein
VNKYVLFMVMTLFLIFMTFIADSISVSSTTDLLDNIPSDGDDSVGSIFRLMGTFFKILTFQLTGIPVVFNIFVFIPLTFGVIFMLIDIIKDLIPFT